MSDSKLNKYQFIHARRTTIANRLERSRVSVAGGVPFKKLVFAIIIFNLIVTGLVFLLQRNLPPEIPLFYGLPYGQAILAPSIALIIPSAASLSVIIVNTTVCVFISDDYLKKALILGALGSTIFSSIAIFKIALLVGNF